ncbi:MAG: DUF547 domain-containing protein [Nitrospirales bacterium]|nr:MAG: DUF547 domain-containing protein [Nitrospirales bacterium]
MMSYFSKWVFTFFVVVVVIAQPAWAFDFSKWDDLLKKYVAEATIDGVNIHAVDYQKLGKDPDYGALVKDLETVSLANVKTKQDKLAFWINVYNVMAVKIVLDHYPVESIKDAGSFFQAVWKKDVGTVGGKTRTLNEIEHGILRKLGEPRIHMAIVCASVSCPDLRKEAYTVKQLDAQLDDQVRKFLANTDKGLRVDSKKKQVYLSSIFKWFKEDFAPKGGVISFITPFAPDDVQGTLKSGSPRVVYLDYNWNLNEL